MTLPPFYALSLGPVAFIYRCLGRPAWMEFLEAAYEPLDYLPEPLESMLDGHAEIWRQAGDDLSR